MRPAFLAACLAAAPLAACHSAPSEPAPDLRPTTPEALHALPVFAGDTGERVAWDALVERCAAADVVVLGELHGHPIGLPFHAQLFREALVRADDPALCLEFVTRDAQWLVDAYASGVLDRDGFVETVDALPGNAAGDHLPLVDAALAAGAPVVAANAPRVYARAARLQGYDALLTLGPTQQALFDVPPELPGGGYRERFLEFAGGHAAQISGDDGEGEGEGDDAADEAPADPHGEPELDPDDPAVALFRSQSLWDATLAASVARELEAGRGPVFLVVGSFHCNRDGGTVQELRRLAPDASVVVVSFEESDADALDPDDVGLADFVAHVGPRAPAD